MATLPVHQRSIRSIERLQHDLSLLEQRLALRLEALRINASL